MNTQQTTTLTDKEISAKMKKAEKKMETKMREETKIKKEEYKNLSLDGKYVYWVNYAVKFIRGRGRFGDGTEKLYIKQIREKQEPQIDKLLQSIIIGLSNSPIAEHGEPSIIIEEYFTFDNKAKQHLRTQTINGINIDNQTLANNIGDLLYNDLADFLSVIGIELQKDGDFKASLESDGENYGENIKQAGDLVLQASQAIQKAWNISKNKPFPAEKHSSQVKGVENLNIELANNISKLDYVEFGQFLQLLALKIGQDGLKDKERGRIKLAEELIKSADLLKQAGDLLEKGVYS